MIIKGLESSYGIGSSTPLGGAKEAKPAQAAEGAGKFFGELVNKVNDLQLQADSEIQKFSSGESKGLHEVMLAMEKSGVAFQFLTQVRNKAMEAYQEVMRMQV